jgi:hypothetical protein
LANTGNLTLEELKYIFYLKSVLNHGLSDNLKSVFPELPSGVRPLYALNLIPLNSFFLN